MRRLSAKRATSLGFTLIDLAIVLAVMSIIAAVVVPGQVSMLHGAKAEATARQITAILDAARWIVYMNAQPTLVEPGRPSSILTGLPGLVLNKANNYIKDDGGAYANWPGQRWNVATVPPTYRCAGMLDAAAARDNLLRIGGLGRVGGPQEARVFTNPWGEPILLSLDSPSNNIFDPLAAPKVNGSGEMIEKNCWFTVTTDVPADVTSVFKRYLPNSVCNDNPLFPAACSIDPMYPVPVDFVRCCTSIPRPGLEPTLRYFFVDSGGNPLLTGPTTAAFCHPWSEDRGEAGVFSDLCIIKPDGT